MAYPEPIKLTGQLSEINDVFEFFTGALLDWENNTEAEDYYGAWSGFIQAIDSLPELPISRQVFYFLVSTYFSPINGANIYSYPETMEGWSKRMANDWGKLKSIELALFGNVKNGVEGDWTLAKLNGLSFMESIPLWTDNSLTFLRYALTRFDSYGACIGGTIERMPPPTNMVVNASARTVNWTPAVGYPNLNDYEYRIREGAWSSIPSKPIVISQSNYIEPYELEIRTKVKNYADPSNILSNNLAIPLGSEISLTLVPQKIGNNFQVNMLLSASVSQALTVHYEIEYTMLGITYTRPRITEFPKNTVLYTDVFATGQTDPSQEITVRRATVLSVAPLIVDGKRIVWY